MSDDRAIDLRVLDILFVSLAVLSTLLRWYTRVVIVNGVGVDDWLMLGSLCFYGLYVISGMISAAHGTGRHEATLSDHDRSIALEHWWLCYIWYDMAMVFARLSIGIFFLRLTIKRIHMLMIHAIMSTTVVFGIIFLGIAVGQCTPPSYFWDKDQDGWCINSKVLVALTYMYSASSLFSDATYAIFPLFLMRRLNMDRRTKWGLTSILGLAWIASIAVLIRFAFLYSITSDDLTYDAVPIAVLSSCEQGLGITAGNLTTLRPLFARALHLFGSSARPRSEGPYRPTVGAAERERRGGDTTKGSIGLVTFLGGRGEEQSSRVNPSIDERPMQLGIEVETDICITTQKRSSLWGPSVSAQASSESEEALRTKQSRETLSKYDSKVVPVSFLGNPDDPEAS
ncbi:hypothetical protein BX600DRAFT_118764 [Xylariales sp. PMI_506]|nr:hypothetical protein BX600DRAFT_118764 [Xylariales sp. PMI_506]